MKNFKLTPVELKETVAVRKAIIKAERQLDGLDRRITTKYRAELKKQRDALFKSMRLAKHGTVFRYVSGINVDVWHRDGHGMIENYVRWAYVYNGKCITTRSNGVSFYSKKDA